MAFGLVNIPIELYSATRDHRPKFRLLHAKAEEPVRYGLIANLESAWNPEKYTDQYKENLMRVINAKVKGRAPTLAASGLAPREAAAGSAGKTTASKRRKAARKSRRVA